MLSLALLLAASPISLHSDLPKDLTEALGRAIENQTGEQPEVTRHHAGEESNNGVEHAWQVRRSTRATTLLIVHFDSRAERIDAQLIDRTGRPTQSFSVDIARGKQQALMSLDALARAAFPKLESPLAAMLYLDQREMPRASKLENATVELAPGAFEVTVEVDRRLAGR